MVREAQSSDFEAIMALYQQLQPNDPALTDGGDRHAFDSILASKNFHLLVLERDQRVVATAYLNVIPNITRSASPYAVIENVIVDAEQRGRGLGQELMSAVLERAWRDGCYKAMLMTGSHKQSTHGFYTACGFSGDDKTAYVARRWPRGV